jgi:hypothetical protein
VIRPVDGGMTDFVNSGLRSGLSSGFGSGQPLGAGDPMAGVTRDSASGKYFPATAGEWNTVFSVAGVGVTFAGNIWLCQEASGNLADVLGAVALSAVGSPSYQQAVSGYTRLAVRNTTDNSTNRFTGTGSDIATNSNLHFWVMDMPTANPAAVRNVLDIGTSATRAALEIQATGVMRGRSVGNTANGAADAKSAVRPVMLQVDRTNSLVRALSDQDKMSPTFDGTMAGTAINIWSLATVFNSPVSGLLYGCRLTGAAAEMTDAQKKTVLQTLGWSIAWT